MTDSCTTYSNDSTVIGSPVDCPVGPYCASDNTDDDNNNHPKKVSDDVKTRQRVLDDLQNRARRKAEAEYLRTSDATVFDPYLAPFVASKKNSERKWVLDQPTQRWYLYNPETDEVLWCPTADSFA